ncbi:UDP-2,4-diacetamido-2,4,6-trideoxy-beta-L-altropyranose hydrolase [Pseudomonas sp. V1]|uniref:UDP-2,4-diacetamido-2,4, 6-trideoxy-beta-L-altropyranose hydrolase n=1 Tax=Pseudomonas arcuscaelestis TaxID=2710591 RepID=UPI00193F158F|nr:UDP-2,4-diacetamido-2,4,6-trideoxy-beta-L-altropyranose hydrolase [Pseudomonas arcuscaelestis]MBM3106682.1 UDP-2,4-diacetamido-2,4,6-trideoxy-beta-L-altropyranose hydrolase [Pseudomonas arcuscaelestis]
MKVIFRVDASLKMGSGHVMRCLTLAHALTAVGADCKFISRPQSGDLLAYIKGQGFEVFSLPKHAVGLVSSCEPGLAHSSWLGRTQSEDFADCLGYILQESPDWLVLDHYALDYRWESEARKFVDNIFVIDDLADRKHCCDMILDQTFGREEVAYSGLIPLNAIPLFGANYALLRPGFSKLREASLSRRKKQPVRRIMVSLGGVDNDNVTEIVLQALEKATLPETCTVTVVMGKNAPWLENVKDLADTMSVQTEVRCDVSDMAALMKDSDLAIGAAGSTSWERCALGLPTIMMVLADNQRYSASLLANVGAVELIAETADYQENLIYVINQLVAKPELLTGMSDRASEITDGFGCERVVKKLIEFNRG